MKTLAILPAVIALSAGCSAERAAIAPASGAPEVPEVVRTAPVARNGGAPQAQPRAVIYRTDGDYDNHVAVNLDASRSGLLSYPAPVDVSESSAPIAVADGWLLDRRGGVGLNTAFLDWTYAEYSKLPEAPSPSVIMAHVLPGARVTAVRELPMTAYEAARDTAAVNACIRAM